MQRVKNRVALSQTDEDCATRCVVDLAISTPEHTCRRQQTDRLVQSVLQTKPTRCFRVDIANQEHMSRTGHGHQLSKCDVKPKSKKRSRGIFKACEVNQNDLRPPVCRNLAWIWQGHGMRQERNRINALSALPKWFKRRRYKFRVLEALRLLCVRIGLGLRRCILWGCKLVLNTCEPIRGHRLAGTSRAKQKNRLAAFHQAAHTGNSSIDNLLKNRHALIRRPLCNSLKRADQTRVIFAELLSQTANFRHLCSDIVALVRLRP
mmetsp:Transcript_85443/g.222257  ORF Transcript_85443/g.222257 Transcript_85443/m.222257 type:complete len:263 (-) Transcript_85443:91-879(-)